ncbi:MAG: exopolysaccharide biosynthesis protein [Alkalinema sp. RU_4_3]|nr:exopolysaccharide biosynthesis protein [Alkalinema sp. RU_4_3]
MKLSQTLQNLLEEHGGEPLRIGNILEQTGEQGFGILCGLLIIPMLIPVPIPLAGLSTILSLIPFLLGLQLLLGYQKPTLPKRLMDIALSPKVSSIMLSGLSRALSPLEHLAQPRMKRISQKRTFQRLAGFCMAWNALLMGLPLPIPFTNLVPAYAILALIIGILELDGLFILLGYALTTATTVFFATLAGAIWLLVLKVLNVLGVG